MLALGVSIVSSIHRSVDESADSAKSGALDMKACLKCYMPEICIMSTIDDRIAQRIILPLLSQLTPCVCVQTGHSTPPNIYDIIQTGFHDRPYASPKIPLACVTVPKPGKTSSEHPLPSHQARRPHTPRKQDVLKLSS